MYRRGDCPSSPTYCICLWFSVALRYLWRNEVHSFNLSLIKPLKQLEIMSGCRWLSRPSALCFIRQLQRMKCILKLSFEGNRLEKKNLFRQITARMKSTFSSWCVSVGRCLNCISIKQDSFIISQIQIEINIGLRLNFEAAILYLFVRFSLFPSNFTPEPFWINLF